MWQGIRELICKLPSLDSHNIIKNATVKHIGLSGQQRLDTLFKIMESDIGSQINLSATWTNFWFSTKWMIPNYGICGCGNFLYPWKKLWHPSKVPSPLNQLKPLTYCLTFVLGARLASLSIKQDLNIPSQDSGNKSITQNLRQMLQ